MAKNQGEGFKHRIKSLLRLRKATTIQTVGSEREEEHDFIFSADVLKELGKDNNVNHRARVLKELCEVVLTRKLEEHAALAVWHEISDMLQASVPTEPRQTTFRFLASLATGQCQRLGMLRAQFLRLIENHDVKDDLNCRIELLRALTDNGKDVSYCEHFGPFLLRFTDQALYGERTDDFLQFMINLVHYNSSFLDKDIITGLVEEVVPYKCCSVLKRASSNVGFRRTCRCCNKAQNEKEIESCLQLLDSTVRYGGLHSEGLDPLIATLCRTVNIERFSQASWRLMKTLVGGRLGNRAIYLLCCLLEDENNLTDSILLRGAVFFIGMCVWGSRRVASIQHKPVSLLPSFKRALHCNLTIIAHEVGLSVHRLVKKYPKELHVVTWDIIMDLIDMMVKLQLNLSTPNALLNQTLDELLTSIEELHNAGKFDGSADRFFAIIERCSGLRPESSALTLLTYHHENLHPAKDGWLDRLKFILEKYFQKEARTAVKVKVLDIVSAVLMSFRFWYEEELLELAVLPYLNRIDLEQDPNVRLVTAQLLIDIVLTCTSNKCMDVFAVINKLINRLMDSSGTSRKANDEQLVTDGEHLRDVKIAVHGLIDAFKLKLYESPALMAIKILEILVEHISLHYINGFTAQTGSDVRLEVFKLFLSIRADERHRVGILSRNNEDQSSDIRFSVFATCKAMKHREQIHSSTVPLGRKLSLTRECPTYKAFDAMLNCLKDEWEWSVLQYVLKTLPDQLRNKTLVLGGRSDVTRLCAFLCSMVNDGLFLNKVRNVPPGSGRADLHNLVFPILAVLVTYHDAVEKPRQIELVKTLELGLNSQCARLCVICLTLCILEMKTVMLRILPSILIKLSKISATVPMSIPMLEFLSSLKEINKLYSNFVEEQYMSIFAIALPYTDAHRYSPYTVTLAHYVISSWFTRCRLNFRKGFVRLITKGLQSSAIIRTMSMHSKDKQPVTNKALMSVEDTQEFHEDMKEVCSDMMAKYSFSTLSNQPKRSPVAEFLLSNGLSQSWLVGNTLVTVTTSGSTSEECTVCIQKRARVTANRAAERLRQLKIDEEREAMKQREISGEKAMSLAKALEADRLQKLSNSPRKSEKARESKKLESSQKPLHTPNDHGIQAEKVSVRREDRNEDTVRHSQPLLITGVVEVAATENMSQRKESRVDSATEMTEESLKQADARIFLPGQLPHMQEEHETETKQHPAMEVHQANSDTELPTADTNQLGSTCQLPLVVSESSSKIDVKKGQEISLVNRLALEQQEREFGRMFSPTNYLLDEMNVSATSSLELGKGQGEEKAGDSESCDLPDSPKKNPPRPLTVENVADESKAVDSSARITAKDGITKREVSTDGATTASCVAATESAEATTKAREASVTERERAETELHREVELVSATKLTTPIRQLTFDDKNRTKESSPKMELSTSDEDKSRLRVEPLSLNVSQNSSLQATPLQSRKSSWQTSIELSSEYELIEKEDAMSLNSKQGLESAAPMPDALCNCSCEGWAEIMIRRPTGNTSWMMKIENMVGTESDMGKLGDIVSLAAAVEVEDFKSSVRSYYETQTEGTTSNRPRFLSVATDEMSRERQSTRSSSDSPKPFLLVGSCDSPTTLRRRRFSTGSMDIPGAFKFGLPSPDQTKETDELSEGSYSQKYQFEKPSLGLSPISSSKRHGSFSSSHDFKDKKPQSGKDPQLSNSFKSEGVSNTTNLEKSGKSTMSNVTHSKPKAVLTKTLSGPTKPDSKTSYQTSSFTHRQLSGQAPTTASSGSPKKQRKSQKDIETREERKVTEKSINADLKSGSMLRSDQTVSTTAGKGDSSAAISTHESETASENQGKLQRKLGGRTDSMKSTTQTTSHSQIKLDKAGTQTSKDSQLKEPFKTGAQVLKEKISSFSAYRPRGKTVSAYPVSKKPQEVTDNRDKFTTPDRALKSALNPYFVFLQFFYSPFISGGGNARPLLLYSGEIINRAVKMLDRIPPYDHHKIGVLYVGPDQESNEKAILANQYGSSRYVQFLRGIGSLISLLDCSQSEVYTGGLDRNGADGKFAYSWRDDITQVIFHVATLMPNKSADPACYSKKLHIGNNFVTIVYNDSKKNYNFGIIKGQFNFAEVLIEPLDYQSNLVTVRMKDDLKDVVTNTGPHVISDDNLPILVRQLAIHTNMATVLHHSRNKPSDAYGCNWLERLKQIKRIRSKALAEFQGPVSSSNVTPARGTVFKSTDVPNSDFTDYT